MDVVIFFNVIVMLMICYDKLKIQFMLKIVVLQVVENLDNFIEAVV